MNVASDDHTTRLHIDLLGGFRASRGGKIVDGLDKGRTHTLLAYLLLFRHAPISRQQLAYTLWPDTPDKQALTNLRTLLYRVRSVLTDADHHVIVTRQTIQVRTDAPLHVDLVEFEEALAQADQAADENERAGCLEKAVALYRGDLLPTCYEDWIAPERERLREAYLRATEMLISLHEMARRYGAAIHGAQRLLRADPLHEATYRRLMRLHALNGDKASALRTYHICVDSLQHDLDVEPGPKTQELYRHLLHRDADSAALEIRPGTTTLLGRAHEWSMLTELWQQTSSGDPCMVAITGEAGIGKTRLAEELVAWAERQGTAVAIARCYETERDLAYGPVFHWLQTETIRDQWPDTDEPWLAEVARVFPQLFPRNVELHPHEPLNARWQRQHLFESLAQALFSGGQRLLLLIDDLQWSDVETLDWLQYLLQGAVQTPFLLLATVRLEEIANEHQYGSLRLALQRSGHLEEIHLAPLSESESALLAGKLAGSELSGDQAADLYRETEGNPLFVVETIRARETSGGSETGGRDRKALDNLGLSALPPRVTAILHQRLAQLAPATQQIIQLAAVIGRDFTFEILALACEQNENTVVNALDEAWRRRIVSERGINAYDFSHDKLRTVAYAQISPIRQRYLHRRVATVLSAQPTKQTDDACVQIAQHYLEAGDPAQAAHYFHQAVDLASRRYAIESLLSASTKALALLQELESQQPHRANQLAQVAILDERMWSWEMVGDMEAYLQDLARLKAIGVGLDDKALLNRESRLHAAALIRLGLYREAESMALASAQRHQAAGAAEDEGICLTIVGRSRRELGEYDEAVAAFKQALVLLQSVESHVFQVQAYSYLSTTYWLMADFERALRCGERALVICESHGAPQRKRFALGDMGAAAAMLGQEAKARQWLDESLSLARQVTDTTQEAFCRAHLGWTALRGGDAKEGERQLQMAYELSRDTDLINYVSWILRGLAECAAGQGHSDRAHTLAAEALSIAQSNGQVREQQAAQRLLQKI